MVFIGWPTDRWEAAAGSNLGKQPLAIDTRVNIGPLRSKTNQLICHLISVPVGTAHSRKCLHAIPLSSLKIIIVMTASFDVYFGTRIARRDRFQILEVDLVSIHGLCYPSKARKSTNCKLIWKSRTIVVKSSMLRGDVQTGWNPCDEIAQNFPLRRVGYVAPGS